MFRLRKICSTNLLDLRREKAQLSIVKLMIDSKYPYNSEMEVRKINSFNDNNCAQSHTTIELVLFYTFRLIKQVHLEINFLNIILASTKSDNPLYIYVYFFSNFNFCVEQFEIVLNDKLSELKWYLELIINIKMPSVTVSKKDNGNENLFRAFEQFI
ncbi:hypothetical protein BpHYR1_011111 [Brachionus plicatilis]|uniref:Uncharacterized protein n=1 Tax=Brachionus plicatilis TaxID=10195 RepID=A0A3M7QBI6_BRAPC|nr:hypothetical protein BpHYR1_011111 [Brachionus plicatilis]